MKIISGKYKNRNINTIKSLDTRPTVSRTREDIFNILNNYFIFQNKIGIDIFAGSGILGIEALSRGLQYCYFNDIGKDAYRIILKNIKLLGINNYKLFNKDYLNFLKYIKSINKKIDLIILDPPFKEHKYYYNVFYYIINYKILNINAIIIIESDFDIDFNEFTDSDKKYYFHLLKKKKYNYKNLYILRWEKSSDK